MLCVVSGVGMCVFSGVGVCGVWLAGVGVRGRESVAGGDAGKKRKKEKKEDLTDTAAGAAPRQCCPGSGRSRRGRCPCGRTRSRWRSGRIRRSGSGRGIGRRLLGMGLVGGGV